MTHRITTNFGDAGMEDPRIAQQLALYKAPATIRSMKNVFIYANTCASLVRGHPLYVRGGLVDQIGIPSNEPGLPTPDLENGLNNLAMRTSVYYSPIGTELKLDISNLVNDLLDIRVSNDKIVYEINLEEVTLESDTSYWENIPDLQFVQADLPIPIIGTKPTYINKPSIINVETVTGASDNTSFSFQTWDIPFEENVNGVVTIKWEKYGSGLPPEILDVPNKITQQNITDFPGREVHTYSYSLGNSSSSTESTSVIGENYIRALKLTRPQTMYCKIKELDNGEPYNWSITNSGSYTIDKSHQSVIHHGSFNTSQLTLQYGHLAFKTREQTSEAIANQLDTTAINLPNQEKIWEGGSQVTKLNDSQRFDSYQYLDYNSEVFNNHENPSQKEDTGAYFISIPTAYKTGYSDNLQQVANRPPYFIRQTPNPSGTENATVDALDRLLQGRPLFFNQQISKLTFRVRINVVNLF